MPRYKQIFRCTDCKRRQWREIQTASYFDEPPAIDAVTRAARCSVCGCRKIHVRQYKIMPRTADQTFPGGMLLGLVDFRMCANRDREISEALASEWHRRIHPAGWKHPVDPEFGWTPAMEPALLRELGFHEVVAEL